MLAIDFIEKKKLGHEHTAHEIKEFISQYITTKIPDYQMAAWLMAVNFQGMSDQETIALVDVMLHSGETLDLSDIPRIKVDKHSTGGVGDKVSLILAPLAVSAGCVVPMISGRGLGHSGGTLDKLESIPGFNVNLSKQQFQEYVSRHGLAMGGQTREIVPADRKMYALRDVTSTVKSIPLICGSILSKKIAEDIDGLVLDIKTGKGAFLAEYNQSQKLARKLKRVGEHFGLKVKAVITDMNQPLGNTIGNWLEVRESIDVLKGNGAEDLKAATLHLAAWMLVLSGIEKDLNRAIQILQAKINSGAAFEQFLQMVAHQDGDTTYIENPEKYKTAAFKQPLLAEKAGFVSAVGAYKIGMAGLALGAGRQTLKDKIKPEVGIVLHKKIGDPVSPQEPLCDIHAPDKKCWQHAAKLIADAYQIGQHKTVPPPLFYETF